MANTNNIKELFQKLDSTAKDEVRKEIAKKFKVSVDTAKNHWIYKESIPEIHKPAVIAIIKRVANKSVNEIQTLIDVI